MSTCPPASSYMIGPSSAALTGVDLALNNLYALPDTHVDIWNQGSSATTIADIAFTPISTTNIEQTNDYEPVMYQSNRSLRAAQAAQELNGLQERNHASTAYTTLDCVATPLYPTFDAQRAIQCAGEQSEGVGSYGPPDGRERYALVRRASSGTPSGRLAPPIGYSDGYYVRPRTERR